MQYSNTAILAFIISFIINYDILRHFHTIKGNQSHKYYRKFLLHVMAFYVTDAIWGIAYENKAINITYFDTILYFIEMAFSILFWTKYVIVYLNDNTKFAKLISIIGNLFFVTQFIFLIINLFTPVLFWISENGVYHTGQVRYIMLILQMIMFASISLYMLYRSYVTNSSFQNRHITIGAFGIAMAIFVFMQTFFPLKPYYAIGCLIGCSLLHTFVIEDEKKEYQKTLERHIQKEHQQELEITSAKHLAYTDPLTGVSNKLAFIEMEELFNSQIANEPEIKFGVVVFDINDLKTINDTKGHDAGDRYIRNACKQITKHFKKSKVYRIGGDEFTAIIQGDDYVFREDLLDQFKQNQNIMSAGMSIFTDEDKCFQDVFNKADTNMYQSKRKTKNDQKGDIKDGRRKDASE